MFACGIVNIVCPLLKGYREGLTRRSNGIAFFRVIIYDFVVSLLGKLNNWIQSIDLQSLGYLNN